MALVSKLMGVIHLQTDIAKLGLDLGEVMTLVVERTLPLVEADGAAIELAEGDDMVYRATAGIAAPHLGLRVSASESLTGLCVRTGKTLKCDDSELDARVDREACRKVGLRSMIVLPLLHKGTPVGVLKAMSARTAKFSEQDEVLLGLLSEVVAAAMYFSTKYDADSLFHKATHDGLTDLANRALFIDRLRNVLSRSQRDQSPAGVMVVDMDGLKQINDSCGHRAGDAAIRGLARRLQAAARKTDTVARLGGDEFGVILTPLQADVPLSQAMNRFRDKISAPFEFEGSRLSLAASLGLACFPEDGNSLDDLLEVADQRMYAAKRATRAAQAALS